MTSNRTGRDSKRPVLRGQVGVTGGSRVSLSMAVLGGEIAVPCTRNPLERG